MKAVIHAEPCPECGSLVISMMETRYCGDLTKRCDLYGEVLAE